MLIGFDARLYGTYHRGLGRYCSSLLTGINKLDTSNKYILFSNTNDELNKFNSDWKIIKAPYRAYSLAEQFCFPFLLNKYQTDLVHFPHWNIPYFYQKPYIVTIHDLILHKFSDERSTTLPSVWYKFKLKMYYMNLSRVMNNACKIIAVSQSTANEIITYYPKAKSKIIVIYEAPTISGKNYENQTLSRLIPYQYLLYVGAAYPHKNLEQLIKAFSNVYSQHPDIKLVLVGRHDFFYKRLQEKIIKRYMIKNVIFWGEADNLILASLYQNALGYIAPSLAEGFNLAAVEALAFNLPVLASGIMVHQEVLKNAALYFSTDSQIDLENKIISLISNPLLRADLLEKARIVVSEYNWQTTAEKTVACYQTFS
ncbi:MAG: glycosyltransferase family 1 protein [Patescibacteria group bacterium]